MVPYLVRVLGPAGYGAVAFAQGFINYLMLFVEYGFNWSATRKISVHQQDQQNVNQTAFRVCPAKKEDLLDSPCGLRDWPILPACAGIESI